MLIKVPSQYEVNVGAVDYIRLKGNGPPTIIPQKTTYKGISGGYHEFEYSDPTPAEENLSNDVVIDLAIDVIEKKTYTKTVPYTSWYTVHSGTTTVTDYNLPTQTDYQVTETICTTHKEESTITDPITQSRTVATNTTVTRTHDISVTSTSVLTAASHHTTHITSTTTVLHHVAESTNVTTITKDSTKYLTTTLVPGLTSTATVVWTESGASHLVSTSPTTRNVTATITQFSGISTSTDVITASTTDLITVTSCLPPERRLGKRAWLTDWTTVITTIHGADVTETLTIPWTRTVRPVVTSPVTTSTSYVYSTTTTAVHPTTVSEVYVTSTKFFDVTSMKVLNYGQTNGLTTTVTDVWTTTKEIDDIITSTVTVHKPVTTLISTITGPAKYHTSIYTTTVHPSPVIDMSFVTGTSTITSIVTIPSSTTVVTESHLKHVTQVLHGQPTAPAHLNQTSAFPLSSSMSTSKLFSSGASTSKVIVSSSCGSISSKGINTNKLSGSASLQLGSVAGSSITNGVGATSVGSIKANGATTLPVPTNSGSTGVIDSSSGSRVIKGVSTSSAVATGPGSSKVSETPPLPLPSFHGSTASNEVSGSSKALGTASLPSGSAGSSSGRPTLPLAANSGRSSGHAHFSSSGRAHTTSLPVTTGTGASATHIAHTAVSCSGGQGDHRATTANSNSETSTHLVSQINGATSQVVSVSSIIIALVSTAVIL